MPDGMRMRQRHGIRERPCFMNGNNKEARARLGNKMSGINDQRAETIAGFYQGVAQRLHRTTALSRQQTGHIFQRHQRNQTPFGGEIGDELPEGPERAAAISVNPLSLPGEGQVLTWERRPCEPGVTRQHARAQMTHITNHQFSAASEVSPVGRRFFRINIIGKQALPIWPQANSSQATASEELIKCQCYRHAMNPANPKTGCLIFPFWRDNERLD